MIRALLSLACVMLLAGCMGTITPDIKTPGAASMNRNGAHSGIYALRLNPDGSIGAQLWYAENRDTFNGCADKYGAKCIPIVHHDCQLGEDPTLHLTQEYPASGWLLESAYVQGKIIPVMAPAGMWSADSIGISTYIQLLKLRADDRTP